MQPRARIEHVAIEESADAVVIHDSRLHQSYSLHPLTAMVWKHADGRTSVPELTAIAREHLADATVTEEMVWLALDSLGQANLLEERIAPPAGAQRVGRRDLIRRVALGGMAAAAVTGFIAPRDASAQGKKNEAAAAAHAEKAVREEAREEAAKTLDARTAGHERGHVLQLDAAWSNAGGGFEDAAVARQGNLCVLSGLVRPLAGAGATIGTLPAGHRPAGVLAFNQYANLHGVDTTTRVDVIPDGRIVLALAAPDVGGWVSLAGIAYRRVPTGLDDQGGDGSQEMDAKEQQDKQNQEAAQKEQSSKSQEQQEKEQAGKASAEENAKEQSSKEQGQKEQSAKSEELQHKEQNAKAAQEQQSKELNAKSAQEQQNKEQSAKAQEQQAKEQTAKSGQEQQQKEQSAKEQAAKSGG